MDRRRRFHQGEMSTALLLPFNHVVALQNWLTTPVWKPAVLATSHSTTYCSVCVCVCVMSIWHKGSTSFLRQWLCATIIRWRGVSVWCLKSSPGSILPCPSTSPHRCHPAEGWSLPWGYRKGWKDGVSFSWQQNWTLWSMFVLYSCCVSWRKGYLHWLSLPAIVGCRS